MVPVERFIYPLILYIAPFSINDVMKTFVRFSQVIRLHILLGEILPGSVNSCAALHELYVWDLLQCGSMILETEMDTFSAWSCILYHGHIERYKYLTMLDHHRSTSMLHNRNAFCNRPSPNIVYLYEHKVKKCHSNNSFLAEKCLFFFLCILTIFLTLVTDIVVGLPYAEGKKVRKD